MLRDKQMGKRYKLISRKGNKVVVQDQFGDVFTANASQFEVI